MFGKLVLQGEAPFLLSGVQGAKAQISDTVVEMVLNISRAGAPTLEEYVVVPLAIQVARALGQELQKRAIEAELKKAEKRS